MLFSRLQIQRTIIILIFITAIYIQEIEAQWKCQSYNFNQRPDVPDTLFNIGFAQSHPKTNPQIGGTAITLNK
jgi:hypothetical protein